MTLLKKNLLCFGVFITTLTIVAGTNDQSAARLELKLEKFSSNGRDASGSCCDSVTDIFGCNGLGATDCDPQLKVCLGGKCSWTREYSNKNSFDFGSYVNDGLTNPLYKEYYPTWPGTASISILVEDVDPDVHDHHDTLGSVLTKTYTHKADKNDAVSIWQQYDFHWNNAGAVTVKAKIRVYCEANFYGPDCGVACIHGDTDDRGHYECHPDNGTKICHEHYYGQDCKKKCVPQDNNLGHYFCDNDGEKICLKGWQGDKCILDVDECVSASPCGSNGNCTNLSGTYKCDCQPEYTGTNCDEVKQFCDDNPCSNNSITCNNTFGGYECECKTNWHGRNCELPPYCNSSPCSNTGVCNDTDDGYVCLCQEGWQGRDCSEEITPCTSSPCLHGGKCTVVDNSYNCACRGPWEGLECQNKIIEIFRDNRTIVLVGRFTSVEETDFRQRVKELLVATLDFSNCTVDTESTYDETEDRTSILITATSHDPRIQGALQKIPITLLGKNLPLYSEEVEPVAKPASKPSPWVKENWYAILLIVLVLVAVIAGLVIFLFVMKKRRLAKSKQSGFDDDAPVHPVNGEANRADAAIGFDNSLYYEIRNPDSVEGIPNGKTLDY